MLCIANEHSNAVHFPYKLCGGGGGALHLRWLVDAGQQSMYLWCRALMLQSTYLWCREPLVQSSNGANCAEQQWSRVLVVQSSSGGPTLH